MLRKHNKYLTSFIFLFLLNGCGLFNSHYDATRHENFTKLKAYHFKFINDYTVGSVNKWKMSDVKRICDLGDLKFSEALIYAKSKDESDGSGAKAVSILKEQFKEDCSFSFKRKKLFGKAWADEQLKEIGINYDYAIAGELSRVK